MTYPKIKAEILWMVMLLLVMLSLGATYIANQQMQTARINQWHDMALRIAWEIDNKLTDLSASPLSFAPGVSSGRNVNDWPHAALTVWRNFPAAIHEVTSWGGELHVMLESMGEQNDLFRLNALGYHVSGAKIVKQWVVACEAGRCRRLSQRTL